MRSKYQYNKLLDLFLNFCGNFVFQLLFVLEKLAFGEIERRMRAMRKGRREKQNYEPFHVLKKRVRHFPYIVLFAVSKNVYVALLSVYG